MGEGMVPDTASGTWVWKSLCPTGSSNDSFIAAVPLTYLQESLAATYGAGVTTACVVDIGATMTSVSVVDDGLVLPDTRSVMRFRVRSDPLMKYAAYSCLLAVTTSQSFCMFFSNESASHTRTPTYPAPMTGRCSSS
jgi:hypothetical protein